MGWNSYNSYCFGFNDSYLLDTLIIELDKVDKEQLTWFDPYLGRSKINDTMVAFAYCSDEVFIVLSKKNGHIVEEEHELYLDHTECEDYDASLLLASHISVLM